MRQHMTVVRTALLPVAASITFAMIAPALAATPSPTPSPSGAESSPTVPPIKTPPTKKPSPTPTASPSASPTPTASPSEPASPVPDDKNDKKKDQPKEPSPSKVDVTRTPVSVSISPTIDEKVGVGQLVTMNFSSPVGRKAVVERAIKVSSEKPLPPGSWGWLSDTTAIYRPKTFWPANAKIKFQLDLDQVVLRSAEVNKNQRSTWVGNKNAGRTVVLKTGRALVITIRDNTHRMYVTRNGKLVKTFPVSLGKEGYRTRSGIKILTNEKYVNLRMRGTDRFSGEDWDVIAPYSIRLTPTGEFIHGAPWAYYRMGLANGSHGCTNMYIGDARWIYHHVRAGDPVITKGTNSKMETTNGTPGSYWNYSYKEWKNKSAK